MFGVKEVQCLRMGELKQIRILSLKSMIIASLSLEYKEVLYSPTWRTHRVFNQLKQTKKRGTYGARTIEGSRVTFSKKN
jgi:hypothetical protein